MVHLDAYLTRIGLPAVSAPTYQFLEQLHLAHLARIPFENIDVRLGRPIGLDPESLQTKLVQNRRGGYCFEHNTLFAAVLRAVGFEVTTLEARVRPPGSTSTLPRTHMTLRVHAEGSRYLADVGFGGTGPLLPVPLDGTPSEQADGAYRVEPEEGAGLVLRHREGAEWRDLYAFVLTPALPIDFEVAHHFTSTHPSSPFLKTLTVQRSEPSCRHILRGCTYTLRTGMEATSREISPAELPTLMRDPFGLDISDEEARLALGDG